jgi:hypothetical protein
MGARDGRGAGRRDAGAAYEMRAWFDMCGADPASVGSGPLSIAPARGVGRRPRNPAPSGPATAAAGDVARAIRRGTLLFGLVGVSASLLVFGFVSGIAL